MLSVAEPKCQAQLVAQVKPNLNNYWMASQLWQRLRAIRKHTGLSGEAFGQELGVSKSAVAQWEAADPKKRTTPGLTNIIDIGAKFGVPYQWLLDDRSEADFAYWEEQQAAAPDPDLSLALQVLGAALLETMPRDVRDDVADALAKLAQRGGAERDQERVLQLLAEGKRRETGT